MHDSPTAWLARRAESALWLVVFHHVDGTYRLVTQRDDGSLRGNGALVRPLSKLATLEDAHRRAQQWVAAHASYGFEVMQLSAAAEIEPLLRVARLRLVPTEQSGLKVQGLWQYRCAGGQLDVVVASDSDAGHFLRIEEPGTPPRAMIGYPSLECALIAAADWMSNPPDDFGLTFTQVVAPDINGHTG